MKCPGSTQRIYTLRPQRLRPFTALVLRVHHRLHRSDTPDNYKRRSASKRCISKMDRGWLAAKKNQNKVCPNVNIYLETTQAQKNWFTQLIFSTHSPRRNIISGVKKWIGVQNRERERKKDSSHFKTFFTCEAVVSNPLCLTIFHLHWWVKKKKLEFVVLFRKLIFKQAPVNSPCCSVFVWERLGAYLCLQRTTDRATPSQ